MNVQLTKMTEDAYNSYIERVTEEYAQEWAKTGEMDLDEAREMSAKKIADLLPQGRNTEGQYLYTIVGVEGETTADMGILWVGTKIKEAGREAFVYDIQLDPKYRGKGLGKKSMALFEDRAQELGFDQVGLHVFFHNEVAVGFYQKLGYETEFQGDQGMTMVKKL